MKLSINLPDELITEVMKISGFKTKTEAIRKAIQQMVDLDKRKKLIGFRGKVDLNIDLDVLRDRRKLL